MYVFNKILSLTVLISVQLFILNSGNNNNIGFQVQCNSFNLTQTLDKLIPTETLSTSELVKRAGYVPIEHNVPTQKGYVINLIRIINPLIEPDVGKIRKGRRTVLFVHGVFSNANSWILMGVWKGKPHDWSKESLDENYLKTLIGSDETSRSLPFLLCNFGYDVWLMNRRNTKQSRIISPKYDPVKGAIASESSHIKNQFEAISKLTDIFNGKTFNMGDKLDTMFNKLIDPKQISNPDAYFDFSYDEQAAFDAPIVIKHILKVTKATKLDWIGHASGCLIPLQMVARFPKLGQKSKLNQMINL